MNVARYASLIVAILAAACSSDSSGKPAQAGGAPGDSGEPGETSAGSGGGGAGLPAAVTALFPPASAQGACVDPALRISFSGPPTLGIAGLIQVFSTADAGAPVATVDLSASTLGDLIGGTVFNVPNPAYVDGNDVVIHLRTRALTNGQTYYVTVDAGAVVGPDGTPISIAGSSAWRFTTRGAPASSSPLTVAPDGSADFCSVQGALDAIPANNNDPALVIIAPGTYREIVHFRSKNNVTIHGQDRKTTVIAGTNNDNLNPGTAARSLVGIDTSSGVVVENLTIHNLTPQGGSQAEALRMQGCDRCVVRNADILSLQDTLLWSGRVYADNCYIAGNVDFVWGTGTVYFNNCELKTVIRTGYNVQSRNVAATYGYVFVDSKLTSDTGIAGDVLARIDASVYPASHVAYINCQLGSHIAPVGWLITGAADTTGIRFWEYQSTDATGALVDVSQRHPASMQLTADQAAMMRDPTVVLAGWQPAAN